MAGATVLAPQGLSILPLRGIPEVNPNDDLAALLAEAARSSCGGLSAGDVVVVTHKVVSKAEGTLVDLAAVTPTARAERLQQRRGGDVRLLEVVLRESARIIREAPTVLICETRHGLVCANAGVDRSNVAGAQVVALLPSDPDASARRLRDALLSSVDGGPLGVIVSDTFGRPFRLGGVNVAIGAAGLPALSRHAGMTDQHGYELHDASDVASADEIAAAAELVMGKVAAVPAALVRGLQWVGEGSGAAELQRHPDRDVFRR